MFVLNESSHFCFLTFLIMLLWTDAGTQRLPRLVGLTKALEMILVRQWLILTVDLVCLG